MNFNFELVKKLFETLKCSKCDNFFQHEAVKLLRQEENNLVVRITCTYCEKDLGIAILGLDKNEYRNSLKFYDENKEEQSAPPDNVISCEDVAEAHRFFSGLGSDWMKFLPKDKGDF